jgi:hypothetical protein
MANLKCKFEIEDLRFEIPRVARIMPLPSLRRARPLPLLVSE